MKVAIIDGNGLSFRIFAQFKDSPTGLLKNNVGLPTTVIFGFLRSLLKLAERIKFDSSIVTWDVTGSKFRKKVYPKYKAHRKHKDMKDYYEELDACRDYMKVFGFNQAVARGIEADDVIAWLSRKLKKDGHSPIIVSDDKDFYQCARGVRIFRPIKNEFVNTEWVKNEFGIHPKHMALLQALTGDKVDNIPGIRGIGPKTASKLINEFGTTVDKLVDNCNHKRWGSILKEERENLKTYLQLTTLRRQLKEYKKWERKRLRKCLKEAFVRKHPKLKKVIQLKEDLELETIDIVFLLRRIGIQVLGKNGKQKRPEIIV